MVPARAIAAAAGGEHDQIAAAEQAGVGLGVGRHAGNDEMIDPGLDVLGAPKL